jgi:hypothetical protein
MASYPSSKGSQAAPAQHQLLLPPMKIAVNTNNAHQPKADGSMPYRQLLQACQPQTVL